MRFLLILPCLFLLSQSILNGHEDEWNKYAHLVKILSRSSNTSSPLACSGTLISPRLVLTASDCVMEGGKNVSEVMVLVSRPSKMALRKRAKIVEVNGTLAYLALVHPMPVEQICHGGIPTDRAVARLSITPSLTHSPLAPFDWTKIDATTCRIVAFQSVKNVDDFLASSSVQTAVMKVEVEEQSLTMRRTDTSFTAPCFEDAGAPFECLVGDQFIQVGLFTSLYAADDGKEHRSKRDAEEVKAELATTTTTPEPTDASKKEEEKEVKADTTSTTEPTNVVPKKPTNVVPKKVEEKDVFARCRTASSLRFSRLDTASVASFIEKYDFSGFVQMYEGCGLIQ